MFPEADSNSFAVPFSDQFLLYSKLLDDADIDSNSPNPYSPFSFFDHPNFMLSDHEQQQLELQNSLMAQDNEEQPIVTAFEDFTMADTRSNGTSKSCYVTTDNFGHTGLADDHLSNGISSHAIGNMSQDRVRRNGNLSKKDRHSKINTAQGPRDRRMRLSLDVARRFFGLQDMLGFDKASKTVDWLLSKSESEIKTVAYNKKNDGNTATTKSDSVGACECYEEVSEVFNKDDHVTHIGATDTGKVDKKSCAMKNKKTGKAPVSLRSGFNSFAKESREKARARARDRTKEKMMICSNSQNHNKWDNNVHHFLNMDQNLLIDQDESLANTLYWNPSSTFSSHLQQQRNEISQQLRFRDAQVCTRPWETYN